MPEPLSIIWSIAMQLKGLIGTHNVLKRDFESLLKIIERLHTNLQRLEGSPDVEQFERVLTKIRISTTKCYAMLEGIQARSWTESLLNQKLAFFGDKPADLIKKQQDEMCDLIDELLGELCTRGVRKAETDDIYEAGSKETRLLGIAKYTALSLTGNKDDDALLSSGEKIRYKLLEDSIIDIGVVYTLEMEVKSFAPGFYNWLLQDRTHLSATLAVTNSSGVSPRVLQITEDNSAGSDSPRACISDDRGVLAHVQTRNHSWFNNAGKILMRDHFRRSLILRLKNGYQPQIYDAEIVIDQKEKIQSEDLLKLRVVGKKFEDVTYYKCDAEASGEVLAVYRHRKTDCAGLLHLLGRGNHLELQTIIIASFAALGLTSDL